MKRPGCVSAVIGIIRRACGVGTLLVLVACSVGSGGGEAARLAPAVSLSTIIAETEAVAVLAVEHIEGPFWNSADGGEWEGHTSEDLPKGVHFTQPIQYSRITVTVEEVWFGRSLSPRVELLVFGDANVRWEGKESPPQHGSPSGGFREGGTFIVALRQTDFWFEDRTEEAWTTAYGWEGNWRVAAEDAVGSFTRWSMSINALRSALGTAWHSVHRGPEA